MMELSNGEWFLMVASFIVIIMFIGTYFEYLKRKMQYKDEKEREMSNREVSELAREILLEVDEYREFADKMETEKQDRE